MRGVAEFPLAQAFALAPCAYLVAEQRGSALRFVRHLPFTPDALACPWPFPTLGAERDPQCADSEHRSCE
ncbi:hypothetical protein GCM10010218_22890 [Streptomyces mashuensis]|uniref:Uncharacterized protein n=1 Tax=Streptomyces mashuensis TaxID=33904 RepID=A0A919B1Z8_9ACTN|nr:hypothetical protein GCM10010218_22890 [Streptomyces mashuensis]